VGFVALSPYEVGARRKNPLKASKSSDAMQDWLFTGWPWKAELRLSVSYIPGAKTGLGSSSERRVGKGAKRRAHANVFHG
jgi:hypothetical protein